MGIGSSKKKREEEIAAAAMALLPPPAVIETIDLKTDGESLERFIINRKNREIAEMQSKVAELEVKVQTLTLEVQSLSSQLKMTKELFFEFADWRLLETDAPENLHKIFAKTNGSYRFKDGVFSGELWASVPNGKGTSTYNSGNVYEGEYYRGKREGKGVMDYVTSKDYYDGEWKAGVKFGQGLYYWGEGEQYQGQFREDTMHGWGLKEYADGRKFLGEWTKGKWNGLGVEISTTGEMITLGHWKDDLLNGEVREYYLKDCFKYEDGKITEKVKRKDRMSTYEGSTFTKRSLGSVFK